jgi:hypothetical protein
VYSFKYLGIHLDSNYCFDVHFNSVLSRVSHALGKIGKIRRFMTKRVFVISLESFVNSILDYGITIWGPSKIKSLPKIQSRISNTLAVFFYPKLRKFNKKSTWKNCSKTLVVECKKLHDKINVYELLERCNQLTISERLKYYAAWNTFKILKCESTVETIRDMFRLHEKNTVTRNSNNLVISSMCTEMGRKSVYNYCATLWNNLLPNELKEFRKLSYDSFKTKISGWLLDLREDIYVRDF